MYAMIERGVEFGTIHPGSEALSSIDVLQQFFADLVLQQYTTIILEPRLYPYDPVCMVIHT